MDENSKEIYISFTKKGDKALIFSKKDKKSMYVSNITLDPSLYKEFEFCGEYITLRNNDGSEKDCDSIDMICKKQEKKSYIVSVLKSEIETHFSGDFTNKVFSSTAGSENRDIKKQIVLSIERIEVQEPIESYCFWLDSIWMRVFTMTKTDLYMMLGVMEYHCMDSGGNNYFNMPVSIDERISAMFSRSTGKNKSNYGLIDDYDYFIKPYKERILQLINDCYIAIHESVKSGNIIKNIVGDYTFDRCILCSDYLSYVETMLSEYINPDEFSTLQYELIRSYKNNYIKEMSPVLYSFNSLNTKVLSKVFKTTSYPFVKTRRDGIYIRYEWLNNEKVAI